TRPARKKRSTSFSIVQRRSQSPPPRSPLLRQRGQKRNRNPKPPQLQTVLGNPTSQQVRKRGFPRSRSRQSKPGVGLQFWHSRNSSRAWPRTISPRVSEPLRVTLPPTKWAWHHHTPC